MASRDRLGSKLADLAQRAQNADNAVGKAMGEIETAATIMLKVSGGVMFEAAGKLCQKTAADPATVPAIVNLCKYFGGSMARSSSCA